MGQAIKDLMQQSETIWLDDFDNLDHWYQDNFLADNLHVAGHDHLAEGGATHAYPWSLVGGRRWAASYVEHREKVQFVRDGMLHLKCHVERKKNPYRQNFTDPKRNPHPYGDYEFYAPCLSHFARKWDEAKQSHVVDKEKTQLLIGPGSIIYMAVDFSRMKTPGARCSAWLMPAIHRDKLVAGGDYAYNDSTEDGAEIDIFEYENAGTDNDFRFRLMTKAICGAAGDTKNGQRNLLEDFGIDLTKGWHSITLKWCHRGTLTWYVDDIEVCHDGRSFMAQSYLMLTREMNSGVKGPQDNPGPDDVLAQGPYRPRDPGLTGRSVIRSLETIPDDVCRFGYLKVLSIKQPAPDVVATDSPAALVDAQVPSADPLFPDDKTDGQSEDSESRMELMESGISKLERQQELLRQSVDRLSIAIAKGSFENHVEVFPDTAVENVAPGASVEELAKDPANFIDLNEDVKPPQGGRVADRINQRLKRK